jgi:hypothetical protein
VGEADVEAVAGLFVLVLGQQCIIAHLGQYISIMSFVLHGNVVMLLRICMLP